MLKVKDAQIGRDVHIGFGSIIVAGNITIGNGTKIGAFTHIVAKRVTLGKQVWIGHHNQFRLEELTMGNESEITNDVEVGGMDSPNSKLVVGERSSIMAHSFVNVTCPVTIGNDVGIGGNALIFTHGSWGNVLDGYPYQVGPVKIHDSVWIPWGVTILPNVDVGEGSVVGARSLVLSDVPAHCLAVGVPAKVIKQKYPAPLSVTKKKSLVKQIMRELEDYLHWKWKGTLWVSAVHDTLNWSVSHRRFILPVIVAFECDVARNFDCPYVSLVRMQDTLNPHIKWHVEIKNFLSRYGIRTESLVQ
jgi:acetyltransferase-like isoleucine patch superfamily enzyme